MILFGFSTSFPLTADEQVACFFNYELSFRPRGDGWLLD